MEVIDYSISADLTSDQDLVIGYEPGHDSYFNGLIDEVTIWDRVLSIDEISDNMNGALASPVAFNPLQTSPRTVGDSFSIDFETSISEPLHDFIFDLTFDPTVLQAVSVDSGPFLGSDGQPITCETPQIDNATGRITGISCQRDNPNGISGEGILTEITFEAIGIGESALRIENASFISPDETAIDFGTQEGIVTVFGPHDTITGRVIDFEGNPVAGAQVVTWRDDEPVGIAGETDNEGAYIIENITEPGVVNIRATRPNLIPAIYFSV